MDIGRNYCVIAYAMPTHSVHSPISVKGIPEPPLVIAWIARYFLPLLNKKKNSMGKVQILAVLSMDGCHIPNYIARRIKNCTLTNVASTK